MVWRLPDRLQVRGTKLLAQQCWGWGCDVRRPEGNLLLAYGFDRHRCPKSGADSSMYALTPAPGVQVALWTFGFGYCQVMDGGLFLDRFLFAPRLFDAAQLPPTIWQPAELPPQRRAEGADDLARLARLLPAALAWIIDYERWALATYGLDYRQNCLAQWSRQKLALPPEQMVAAWESLAAECNQALAAAP